jgi:hypothetical protein
MTVNNDKRRSNEGSLLLGGMLVTLGILFLIGQLFDVYIGRWIWPFFVMAPGVLLFSLGLAREDQPGVGMAIAGSIVTSTGVLLFLQNITGLWASWAYAWALIAPTSVGAGQMLFGKLKGRPELVTTGARLVKIGGIIFLVGFVFFELLIGVSGFGLGRIGWPLFLIGLGVLLVAVYFIRGRVTTGSTPALQTDPETPAETSSDPQS